MFLSLLDELGSWCWATCLALRELATTEVPSNEKKGSNQSDLQTESSLTDKLTDKLTEPLTDKQKTYGLTVLLTDGLTERETD